MLTGEKTSSEICRVNKLNANVLNRWCKEFLEQAVSIFERDATDNEAAEKIAELERLVGQLTVQLEIARKASNDLSLERNGRQ
jgi:transposase